MSLAGFAALAIVAGITALGLSALLRRRLKLPHGEVLYQDLGGRGFRADNLVSNRLHLCGKPDLLIDTGSGVVPLELKQSTIAPRAPEAYDNHRAQLLAYCLLAEEVLGRPVPYGIVRYQGADDRIVRNEAGNREWLIRILNEVSAARLGGEQHRNHHHAGRCCGCGFAGQCGEMLSRTAEGKGRRKAQ